MDFQALQARVDELMSEFDRLRGGAAEMQRKIAEVRITERSRDGYVSATVGPRGQLIRLDLDPRIYRNPDSRNLADTITETVQRATRAAADRVEEICAPFIDREELRAHLDGDIDRIVGRIDAEIYREGD